MSASNGFVLHGFSNEGSALLVWLVNFPEETLENTSVQLVCHGSVLKTKSVTVNYAEIGKPHEPPSNINIGSVRFSVPEEIKDDPDCTIVVLIGEKKLDPIKV